MITTRELRELERLKRDLANGRIAASAHGNTVVRIAELERKSQPGAQVEVSPEDR